MTKQYINIIRKSYEDVIKEYKTEKKDFEKIFIDLTKDLLETKNQNYEIILNQLLEQYINGLKAISMLSPGLSTGLHDYKHKITINTYSGKMSDIPNDKKITAETVFDASSMTKMFTTILLLKEEEKGNIDLTKKFSDYSPLLKNLDVPIIDALKFKVEIKSKGRVDEENIDKEERIRRILSVHPVEKNTFIYSDMAYMVVPLLFGKTIEEATDNYINKFYSFFRDGLGLSKTGYSTINMTGGLVDAVLKEKEDKFKYTKKGVFDPKANIITREIGLVTAHAGLTTTVEDLEKLFDLLNNNLLGKKSLEKIIEKQNSEFLLDKNGRQIIRKDKPVRINHGMGVYISSGGVRGSDISDRYSKKAFAAEGSTGTFALFDLENGFNATFLSNIKSAVYSKLINTGKYGEYLGDENEIPNYFDTTILSGTNYFKNKKQARNISGSIMKTDESFISFAKATNKFKELQLDTLLKLRIAKLALTRIAVFELENSKLEENIKALEKAFNNHNYRL